MGRSPRQGWKVPWDQMISREHVDLQLNEDRLTVRCLGTARNAIVFNDETTRTEFQLSIGEAFRIGETSFQFVDVDATSLSADPLQEFSYRPADLAKFAFQNDRERLNALSQLPQLIAESKSNEEFAAKLCDLLLLAIPKADAAAVMQFEDGAVVDTSRLVMMRWGSREKNVGRFSPSRRLIGAALKSGESLLYVWPDVEEHAQQFTVSGSLDWAFCTPIGSESHQGWCIYVSGKRADGNNGSMFLSEDDLKGDLRFAQLLAEFVASIREVKRLQRQHNEMSQYFSPAVIESIANTSIRESVLTPKEQDISVLFCDVRGFSRQAEKARHALLDLLNRVSDALGVMTNAIMRFEGVIADFQGDAALAFWGWPYLLEDGPVSACRAALAMHQEFTRANRSAGSPLAGFQVGIGIGHGRAIAGKIGSEQQCKVGVFGPVVNLASRLEGMTKQFRVPILIDERTAEFVREHFPANEARVRRLGRVRPKGMDQPLMVCELLPPETEEGTISNQLIAEHEKAVDAFVAGNWSEAFDSLDATPVGNRAKELLLIFMAENNYQPPDDWDGIINLTGK